MEIEKPCKNIIITKFGGLVVHYLNLKNLASICLISKILVDVNNFYYRIISTNEILLIISSQEICVIGGMIIITKCK